MPGPVPEPKRWGAVGSAVVVPVRAGGIRPTEDMTGHIFGRSNPHKPAAC